MDDITQSSDALVSTLPVAIVTIGGETVALEADFAYDPGDPLAVTVVFHTATDEVRWTFARDLLAQGVYSPVGEGDVRVWPCLDSLGHAVTIVELVTHEGDVLVQVESQQLVGFVTEMLDRVPLGAETITVDWSALLS